MNIFKCAQEECSLKEKLKCRTALFGFITIKCAIISIRK